MSEPIIYCDGIHDDTEALQAAIDGKVVRWPDGRVWNYIEPVEHHSEDSDEA